MGLPTAIEATDYKEQQQQNMGNEINVLSRTVMSQSVDKTLGTFRFDCYYEIFEIEYKYDFSNLVCTV